MTLEGCAEPCSLTVMVLSGMALSAVADCLLIRLTSSLPLIFESDTRTRCWLSD